VQVSANSVLEELSENTFRSDFDREIIAVLGITSCDLFCDNCSYVFGHAAPKLRACVCSTIRLREGEDGC
jgi:predicted Zn-dependent protease